MNIAILIPTKNRSKFVERLLAELKKYNETIGIAIYVIDASDDTKTLKFVESIKDSFSVNYIKSLGKTIDDDDLENPLGYFLDVYEDGTNSNIVITKDKLLTSVPSYVYSFTDGLENYEGKKRNPANTVFYDKNLLR